MESDVLIQDALGALAGPAKERREHVRHPITLRVLVAIGNTILHGRAENLAYGGACVRVEEILPEGTGVTVRFLTPYLEKFTHIDIAARVQYTILSSAFPPYKTGLKFTNLDAETKKRIGALIQE